MIWLFCLLVMAGCSPSSLADYIREGEAQCHRLAAELAEIETREDLIDAEKRLKRRYEELVDLMISARELQVERQEELPSVENSGGEKLRDELVRIYEIEGGREIMERCQQEALNRLDLYVSRIK